MSAYGKSIFVLWSRFTSWHYTVFFFFSSRRRHTRCSRDWSSDVCSSDLALFMIAATAESNRSPFDLPEGESEIIAGYYIEYSGFKFALFFLGEYIGMFAVSGLAITLFLGGWHAPFRFLSWIPSYIWFFGKLLGLIALFIWVRGTLPRLRMDQLMNFAWKFMLPMALINLLAAGIWRFLEPGIVRWLICSSLVLGPYVMLGRGLLQGRHIGKRTYRYAD